jgi:SNF2 family DNA or RNA helicase
MMFEQSFKVLSVKKGSTGAMRSVTMQQFRVLLKAIMLRRMKNSEIDGKPILTLPQKTQMDDFVELSAEDMSSYKEMEKELQTAFTKILRRGTVGRNYACILTMLLRLRQACCHSYLNLEVRNETGKPVEQDVATLAKAMSPSAIERLLNMKRDDFECPVCLDAIEDPLLIVPCGHEICSECFTSILETAQGDIIARGEDANEVEARCPQCRGEAKSGRTVTVADFNSIHRPQPEPDVLFDSSARHLEDSDDEDLPSLEDRFRQRVMEKQKEKEEQVQREQEKMEREEREYERGLRGLDGGDVLAFGPQQGEASFKREQDEADAEPEPAEMSPDVLKSLRSAASRGRSKEARRDYMNYLRSVWVTSAKVSKMMSLVKEIQESGEKTIIFSQWTSMLDLLEVPLRRDLGLRFSRYDGSMNRRERDAAVAEFVDNPDCKVILVSLRAGNSGLNLTAASHVIICDPFWNPYTEMQAVDRAHRIGQQRPVTIHRILVKDTIEDRITDLQERKRNLINAALDEGEAKNLATLSTEELRYLFGLKPR